MPWFNWNDTDLHCQTDPNWTTQEQKDADIMYKASKKVYYIEAKVLQASINTLNTALLYKYKQVISNFIGTKIYHAINCTKKILGDYCLLCGIMSPSKKTLNKQNQSVTWSPSDQVKELLNTLKSDMSLPSWKDQHIPLR